MTDPIDLASLRLMTDGDAEMERELFDEFLRSFEEGITALHQLLGPTQHEAWRKQAHALKGMAVNLGAAPLGVVCKHAQEQHAADTSAKQAMLSEIEAHYAAVRNFLAAL